MNDNISQRSIKKLLSDGSNYVIPMYQRNYAWDEGEITQLIQDVIDSMPKGTAVRNYYIGTLVVYKRKDTKHQIYETIDGQQRLITLSLLASYLKNVGSVDVNWYKELRIDFDSREHSRLTFTAVFEGNLEKGCPDVLCEGKINTAILDGYRLIQKILPQKLKDNQVSDLQFADYLFDRVQIMRVEVPQYTDLNHYFEIMNNRGEQLEKHEVLKSRLLAVLNKIDDETERQECQTCLDIVWEACANMEQYVQMGFEPKQRNAVFGKNWGKISVNDFDTLRKAIIDSKGVRATQDVAQTIEVIIAGAKVSAKGGNINDESLERFNTVINFPNFLLQVLRVESGENIPLDDKRLIDTFDQELLKAEDPITRVKNFVLSLLKCKYLFDKYVIKREFIKGADGWSLKRLEWKEGDKKDLPGRISYENTFGDEEDNEGVNRSILMLLSAFHVSTPTMVYKHWLNAALNHLFHAKKIQSDSYLEYLESVATAFVFDRYLAEGSGAEYFDIIYRNKGRCQTRRSMVSENHLRDRLSFGQIENNLVFNFLDYCLWLKNHKREKKKDPIVSSYEFTFRSSVEHYYPQNPMSGQDHLPDETLNSFGNLCLISHSKNSRLSNFMPEAKKEYYQKNTIDSVKQYMMMKDVHWNAESIAKHYEAMKAILLEQLADDLQLEQIQKD